MTKGKDVYFTKRDPGKGYITNNLLIPKSAVNEAALKTVLSFEVGVEKAIEEETGQAIGTRPRILQLWDETKHHLIVPREFLSEQEAPRISWVHELHEPRRIDYPDKIVPRETQTNALYRMEMLGNGTINIGCGKGKTVLALLYIVRRKSPAIIVVNSGALMHQWELEIQKHIGKHTAEGFIPVGHIVGDQCEWRGYPIVLAMVQTLANRVEEFDSEFRRYFGVAFFDEGHHMSAPHFTKAADLFYGNRFSLTATATRGDGLQMIYQYHLGPVIYQDLEQALIPETVFHQLHWEPTMDQTEACIDKGGTNNHGLFCVMLGTVDWRNEYITENVLVDYDEGRDVLVLAHSTNHVRALYNKWPYEGSACINSKDVPKYKDRINMLRGCNPVFATFQLAREALDKKTLAGLHICSSFASSNDVQQSWGRTQRDGVEKLNPRINVYEDVGIRMSKRQCGEIRTFLKALGYPIEKLPVEIQI